MMRYASSSDCPSSNFKDLFVAFNEAQYIEARTAIENGVFFFSHIRAQS